MEWSACMTPLEPFFKGNSHFQPRFGYPHTLPHTGRGIDFKSSFVHHLFIAFSRFALSPTSVGFMARAAAVNLSGCRARQKPPSSLTLQQRVHPRTGLLLKDNVLDTSITRVKSPLTRERQRLGDFSPLRGSASSPPPFGGNTLHVLKHPRLWPGGAFAGESAQKTSLRKLRMYFAPARRSAQTGFTDATRVKNPLMRGRQRLGSLCAISGMSAFALYPLRLDTPFMAQNIQDFGLGRAGEPTRAFFQVFRNPVPLA